MESRLWKRRHLLCLRCRDCVRPFSGTASLSTVAKCCNCNNHRPRLRRWRLTQPRRRPLLKLQWWVPRRPMNWIGSWRRNLIGLLREKWNCFCVNRFLIISIHDAMIRDEKIIQLRSFLRPTITNCFHTRSWVEEVEKNNFIAIYYIHNHTDAGCCILLIIARSVRQNIYHVILLGWLRHEGTGIKKLAPVVDGIFLFYF